MSVAVELGRIDEAARLAAIISTAGLPRERRIRHLLAAPHDSGARPAPVRLMRARGLAELLGVLDRLALLAPALREGEGDLVVADTSARLPFAASHRVNPLTHIEALWDGALQTQVLGLLHAGDALVAA